MATMNQMRTCKTCGESKLAEEFYLYDKTRNYRSRSCIPCEQAKRLSVVELTRICKTCGTEQPIDKFNFSSRLFGYRRHECLTCETARMRTWHSDNIVSANAKMKAAYEIRKNSPKAQSEEKRLYANNAAKKTRIKHKDLAFRHYGGYICACCGETEPLFLTLDHVNNDGYVRNKYGGEARSGARLYHWLHAHSYPEGFQVLCMNCNLGKARNGGICPHNKVQRLSLEREYTQAGGSASQPTHSRLMI